VIKIEPWCLPQIINSIYHRYKMPVPHFYLYLYVKKDSTKIGNVKELLPLGSDLDYTLRMILYNGLKSYMDERDRGDFIVILHEKKYYYKVHLESLGGECYDTPSSFVDRYLDKYKEFKIDGCSLKLEYEIDDS
jgi:hypothetical protein